MPVLLGTVAVLLVPGRVQGRYYRDFFRARELVDERRFAESLPFGERFLDRIRARPGLKRLVWLSWPAYSPDIEAMALNNLGAAHLELGDFEAAERRLGEAMALDPLYPVPVFNLAMLAAVGGDTAAAMRLLEECVRLGYRRTAIDDLIHRSQALLARLEGRGVGPPRDAAV
jgi:tetratricopeptide (TPR) repeat protein